MAATPALAATTGKRLRVRRIGPDGLGLATLLVAMAWTVGAFAQAPGTTDAMAAKVQAAAEQAVREHFDLPGNRIEVAARTLNPNLHLAPCPLPLEARLGQFAKAVPQLAVLVQCATAHGWSTRVTVKLQLFRGVLVTTRPLLGGDGVRATDVRAEERDVTHLGYGYIENLDQIAGRTLTRELPDNSVLTPAALGGRRMVRAGDQVQMIAQTGGIEVRATGVALGSGDNGARLRVRNSASGKVIDGIVLAPGEIRVLP
ncbi:MAG: flagellar basal body P-ring formation chaperone FlgA [Rhodanobacter sp.]